ncbi:MAG: AAA family ATPase [Propionibacteriaceae bacterium]|nr:AAA family ATPase [Propionibacteriaceae bacterium]
MSDPPDDPYAPRPRRPKDECAFGGETEVVQLGTVVSESVSWLWPAYLPAGKLVILEGDPSVGKSTLALDIAARVSTGRKWPDGTTTGRGPMSVVLLNAEDGLSDTIKPRLEAAGADVWRVFAVQAIRQVDKETGENRSYWVDLKTDIRRIETVIRDKDAALIVIDVLMAYLGARVDSHRDQDVRGVLGPLADMADRTHCTVILIRHLNKGTGQAIYRGGGSIGIIGAARSAFVVARDQDNPDRRLFACQKSNLGKEPPTLAYRLVETDFGCARVEWESNPVEDMTAENVLSGSPGNNGPRGNEADRWLKGVLADGPREAAEVIAEASTVGFDKKAVQNARSRARNPTITSTKSGMNGGWIWSLAVPKVSQGTEELKNTGLETLETFGIQGDLRGGGDQ